MLSLNSPEQRTLKAFQRHFKPMETPLLFDYDENLFLNGQDLVALAPVDSDRLNSFLKKYFGYFFRVC